MIEVSLDCPGAVHGHNSYSTLLLLDIWFHVDNLSSAHVYLKLRENQNWLELDEALLKDCAQLVKAHSIEGNKRDNITVIYTPWSNLIKTKSMEVGTVSFKSQKKVKKIFVPARDNPIVNRLMKTKLEKEVDHRKEYEERQRLKKIEKIAAEKKKKEEELKLKLERERMAELKSYKGVMETENMQTNLDLMSQYKDEYGDVNFNDYEDNFM